eukprot:jgi/Tetstr1/434354/TSEL_023458.t1
MLVNRFERVEVQLAAVTASKRPASPPDETPSLAKHSWNEMPARRNDDASGSRRGRRNVKRPTLAPASGAKDMWLVRVE